MQGWTCCSWPADCINEDQRSHHQVVGVKKHAGASKAMCSWCKSKTISKLYRPDLVPGGLLPGGLASAGGLLPGVPPPPRRREPSISADR